MNTFISTILLISQLSLQICTNLPPSTFEESQKYFITHSETVQQSDFELVGGLVFLEAELNGKMEQFILDTGAPHFFLNDKNMIAKKDSGYRLNGVGGSKKITRVRGLDFNWNQVDLKRKTCYAADLENISKIKDKAVAGLIGYDQVKKQQLLIDYENKKVFLISKSNKTFFDNHKEMEKIKFKMVGHMPIVKVKIGGKQFHFAIDTGAEVNVVDRKIKKEIPENMIEVNYSQTIIGGDNQQIPTTSISIKSTRVGASEYKNMPFVFADLSFLNRGGRYKIDGLLGYPFLKEELFSIDFRKKQLVKWKLKKNGIALQFAIKN